MAYNVNDIYVGRSLEAYGEYSEGEVRLLRDLVQPGMNVCEVGSNIGAHTIPIARMVGNKGTVLAFEPQRMCYYLLCGNVALNGLANVVCLQNAVANEEGRVHVPELDQFSANNHGGMSLRENRSDIHGHSIRKIRIDDFKLPTCGLIKLDVEGMEMDVLLGARETIARCRPFLYVEADRGDCVPALLRLLDHLGYACYAHTPPLFEPENHAGNPNNHFLRIVSINVFCHPKEIACPVSLQEHGLRLVERGQTIIAAETTEEQVGRNIEATREAVIHGLCGMAANYADRFHDFPKAMEHIDKAIDLDPDRWETYNRALPIMGAFSHYNNALEYAEKALECGGGIDVLFNKATILGSLERYEEAITCLDRVLEERPECVDAHFNKGINLLGLGRYQEGWEEYEWRFHKRTPSLQEYIARLPDKPTWTVESLDGKTILLYSEQGAGDFIQFLRYVPMVKHQGARIVVSCQPNLQRLARTVEGVDEVVDTEDVSSVECDYIHSLISFPRMFRTTPRTIPIEMPYVRCPRTSKFSILNEINDFQVGLCWAGNESHPMDSWRSCELNHFNTLANLPGLSFVNLQFGNMKRKWRHRGEVDLMKYGFLPMRDLRELVTDYADTADILHRMDLVITVDTSLAHLAGAMGKKVWVLLGRNPDWRWGNSGDVSHWYPNTRIFRCEDLEDGTDPWRSTASRVHRRLEGVMAGKLPILMK